jgi:Bacterial Ig-like domain (group 2)
VSSRTKAAIAAVLLVVSGSSCNGPTNPCIDQSGRGTNAPLGIIQTCTPVGPNVQCTAVPSYADYAYCPQPLPPLVWTSSNSSIATVSSDGFVKVLARGEVDITAAATSGYGYRSPQTWSALVDPGQPPQVLYFLSGIIRENDGSDTRIPGATVEILDGYNAGRTAAPSNQFGAYRIDRVLTNVTFTVRASKSGYVPSTTTYLVGGPTSIAGPPFLDFRLSRGTQ